ncbi:hypothetical protein ACROYT_G015533 [Oculina patagonica]
MSLYSTDTAFAQHLLSIEMRRRAGYSGWCLVRPERLKLLWCKAMSALIWDQLLKPKECPLGKTGEAGCEVYFSINRSWVNNHHAYTALDMDRNYEDLTRIAEYNQPKVKFSLTNYKPDNIWRSSMSLETEKYPTPREIIEAWCEGVSKTRCMARMHSQDNSRTDAGDIPHR